MAAKLFISYSHEDEDYKNQLLTHLTLLKREGLVEPWHDRTIHAGEDFSAAIDGAYASRANDDTRVARPGPRSACHSSTMPRTFGEAKYAVSP